MDLLEFQFLYQKGKDSALPEYDCCSSDVPLFQNSWWREGTCYSYMEKTVLELLLWKSYH